MLFLIELNPTDRYESLTSMRAYYLRGPYRSVNDTLFQCNLPNILAHELVCQGDDTQLQEELQRCRTDQDRIQMILCDFWTRPFSDHAMQRFFDSRKLHPAFTSFADWEATSRRDPKFVERVAWRPLSTLQQQLQRLTGGFFR